MTVSDTTGVAILSALLKHLASHDSVQVAEFAAEKGFARATTFLVSRRLREHGFVIADAERGLAPGPVARQFAWAALGCPELAGPAEAVMRWLLTQVDGQVSLTANGVLVIELGEGRQGDEGVLELEHDIRDGVEGRAITLTLRLSSPQREQTVFAQRCLERAALTLGNRTDICRGETVSKGGNARLMAQSGHYRLLAPSGHLSRGPIQGC